MDAFFLTAVFLLYSCQFIPIQGDDTLEQCKQKLKEQLSQIDFTKWPSCLDADKINSAANSTKIFGKFYDTLPEDCHMPTRSNIKECLGHAFSYFKEHSDEIQAGLATSINSLYEGSKGCIDLAVKKFSGLDDYIAKGCQGDL